MKKYSYFFSIVLLIFLTSCSDIKPVNSSNSNSELLEFAKVNCMFWYFKKMNYSTKDIRAISGGIVELGTYSAEKYSKVAILVKEYKPNIQTKQNIDIELLKCYQMDKDKEFLMKIESIK